MGKGEDKTVVCHEIFLQFAGKLKPFMPFFTPFIGNDFTVT